MTKFIMFYDFNVQFNNQINLFILSLSKCVVIEFLIKYIEEN